MATEAISATDVADEDNRNWTRREDLALASAVDRVGDRAWTSVARLVAPLSDSDFALLTARACARRYAELTAAANASSSLSSDSQRESLIERLTSERISELRSLLDSVAEQYKAALTSADSESSAATITRRVADSSGRVVVVTEAELAGLTAKPTAGRRGRPRKSLPAAQDEDRIDVDEELQRPISPLAGSGFHELSIASKKSDLADVEDEDEEQQDKESAANSLSASLNASSVSLMLPSAAAAAAAASSGGAASASASASASSSAASSAAPVAPPLEATSTAASAGAGAAAATTPATAASVAAVGKEFVDSPEPSDPKAVKHWRKQILSVLRAAMGHKHGSVFSNPVTEEIAPGYNKVVLRPMDLTTLKRLVDSGEVNSTRQFLSRLYLIFFNAVMYNNADQPVHAMALEIWADTCNTVVEMLGRVDGPGPMGGGGAGGGGGGGDTGGELSITGGEGSESGDLSASGQSHLAKALRHHHARRSEQLQHPQLLLHHHLHQQLVGGDDHQVLQLQRRRTASHNSGSSAAAAAAATAPADEAAATATAGSSSSGRQSTGAAGDQPPPSKKRRV